MKELLAVVISYDIVGESIKGKTGDSDVSMFGLRYMLASKKYQVSRGKKKSGIRQ